MSTPYVRPEINEGSYEEQAQAMQWRFDQRVAAHERAVDPNKPFRQLSEPASEIVVRTANSQPPTPEI